MKSSQIAAYIAERNVRIYMGGPVPFLPLAPLMAARTAPQIGWVAYQLARFSDPEVAGDSVRLFHFSEKLGSFGLMSPVFAEDVGGWKQVEWDGYGELASWKEVAG